jgi:hypothetical protein
MATVQVPNLGTVTFADDMPQSEVLKAIQGYQAANTPTTTEGGAATGVFPQMTGRRQVQDTERSKNIPQALVEAGAAGIGSIPAAIMQMFGSDVGNKMVNAVKQHASDISYPAVAELGSGVGQAAGAAFPVAKTMQMASKIPALGASELVRGGLGGLTAAMLTPTKNTENYSEFLTEKGKQLPAATLSGAITNKMTQMLMNPKVSPEIQKLMDLGMTKFTPGQLLSDVSFAGVPVGKGLQVAEKSATSVPLLGDIVGSGLRTSFKDFNKAMANKALEPLGIKVPANVKEGEETNQFIQTAIDNAYNAARNGAMFRSNFIDTTGRDVAGRLNALADQVRPVTGSNAKQFDRTVQQDVIDPITKGAFKLVSGDTFRQLEENLGQLAFETKNTALSNAYRKMLEGLRQELALQNPGVAKHLANTHEVFKNANILQNASGRRANVEGIFSPEQFSSAVKGSAGAKATASGMGRFQDEAAAATNVLGNSVPNSGTAGRAMVGAGILGGVSAAPFVGPLALKSLVASGAYSPLGMKVLTNMATKRPAMMRQAQPAVSAGLTSLGGSQGAAFGSPQPDVDADLPQ